MQVNHKQPHIFIDHQSPHALKLQAPFSAQLFFWDCLSLIIFTVIMHKGYLGLLLILMMFGHNFVLNQTQTMQKSLMDIHNITITQFNLLYSIPSAISILFIIPMGFFYEKYHYALLAAGAVTLSLGQALITAFASQPLPFFYTLTMTGRVLEGVAAQILYMIQGNMASSWMGKYAGVVFILPQFGQIFNVIVTPWTSKTWGVWPSFAVGLVTCLISTIACALIYLALKKQKLKKAVTSEDIKHMEEVHMHETHQSIRKLASQEHGHNEKLDQVPHELINSEYSRDKKLDDKQTVGSSQIEHNEEQQIALLEQPRTVFQAGPVFWLVILLCGINECLYFPFLDNANELIINRFCISYQNTGYYLSIPFIAAMVTSAVSSYILNKIQRKKLIFIVSFIPLIGHSIIFLDSNCEGLPTLAAETTLIIGLCFFGMGIGSYYSVSFPAVGLSIPQQIRGMGYACMGFVQTISMTLIPIISGEIIETEQKITKLSEGYKQSSLLFVIICMAGVVVSLLILRMAHESSFMYDDEHQLDQEESEVKSDEGRELSPISEIS